MFERPFRFRKTGFYMIWSAISQWRFVKIGLAVVFLVWVKDGTVDPVAFKPLCVVLTGSLALASLMDTVLLLLPARVLAYLTRTRAERDAWEAIGAMEAKR